MVRISFIWAVFFLGFLVAASVRGDEAKFTDTGEVLRVGVVGDTGIGERAYHPGFVAVQEALRAAHPDVLLHLGDFVYQPDLFPESCKPDYIREIRETLVAPFVLRLFVPGDNDLPPHKYKPKASGCWGEIDPLDSGFDTVNGEPPAPFEGTRIIGNSLFAVLNSYPWQDPTAWLKPRIEKARREGLWIVVAVHEPALTTAWFIDKRASALKQINALKPDLVFSGNQHSYERFHPITGPEAGASLRVTKSESSEYRRGEGTIHIISGGGGATFKPFADQQGNDEHTAPEEVRKALAVRALMNHYLILEISKDRLEGSAYLVCPRDKTSDPRWKPGKKMWDSIRLECEDHEPGVEVFDRFVIRK